MSLSPGHDRGNFILDGNSACYSGNWRVFTFWVCGVVVGAGVVKQGLDELYRLVGWAEVMAAQMSHLAAIAVRPDVTLQVLPAVAHPANASEFIVTDSAAYAEHVAGGYVFTEEETVTRLARLFHTILSESYRASDSAAMIEEVGQIWTAGASPATQTPTAARA
jgi:Domain of unknown function (DUF5753)